MSGPSNSRIAPRGMVGALVSGRFHGAEPSKGHQNHERTDFRDQHPSAPTPVLSVSPIVLPAPGRAVDLQVRVSAHVTGSELPILLLSHGHGRSNHLSSLNGYAPLANDYAAHGFVVIQPTHLDSKTLTLDSKDPDAPPY